jgi:hypothetical protein
MSRVKNNNNFNNFKFCQVVGEITLLAATGDMKARMLQAQNAFVSSIVDRFDSRIQNKQIALDLRECLDFRRMPLADSEASNALLMTHGDDAVERVVRSHFPDLDAEIVKDELLAAKIFVRETQARYLQQRDPDDAIKGTILLLTGRGSIFEALFSRSNVCSKSIPSLLIIADYMISFMWQSCCGERAGSHINRTKTLERTLLGDQTFDSLVFNTFNMPHLHEMDFDALNARWAKSGHKMGTFNGSGDSRESASKVVRRHLAATSSTFLFKAGD